MSTWWFNFFRSSIFFFFSETDFQTRYINFIPTSQSPWSKLFFLYFPNFSFG